MRLLTRNFIKGSPCLNKYLLPWLIMVMSVGCLYLGKDLIYSSNIDAFPAKLTHLLRHLDSVPELFKADRRTVVRINEILSLIHI